MREKIVILYGPTSVGKTSIALRLAEIMNAEIISADSMQVYKGLDVGTAKPTKEELSKVRHHLVDICDIDEPFSAGDFVKETLKILKSTDKNIIIAGGTSMYIYSLINGIHSFPKISEKIKKYLNEIDIDPLYNMLKIKDPEYALKVGHKDRKRIIRALEIKIESGKKYSEWLLKRPRLILNEAYELVNLTMEREKLYNSIECRIDQMLLDGWVEEVKNLLKIFTRDSYGFKQAIGYSDIIDYISKNSDFEGHINNIKKKTRNYAKRQITWFNKLSGNLFDTGIQSKEYIVNKILDKKERGEDG